MVFLVVKDEKVNDKVIVTKIIVRWVMEEKW